MSIPELKDTNAINIKAENVAGLQSYDDLVFPFVVENSLDTIPSKAELSEWVALNRDGIEWLNQHVGGVLFRNFGLKTDVDFDQFIALFNLPNFTYAESLSNAVRMNRTERVFTANEAPPEVNIVMHHEMAQTPVYPSRLFFFCEKAAEEAGQTPLCRSDILLNRLEETDPELIANCRAHGLKYISEMPAHSDQASGQGRSWMSTLGVNTKEEAEQKLDQLRYQWKWVEEDALQATTPILPAIRALENGKESFFNQLISAAYGWKTINGRRSVSYGNGQEIPETSLKLIADIVEELSFDLNWQTGDAVLVNNYLVMHGRRPYSGTRRVLASLVA